MSQDIIQEVTFFLHSVVMGVVITFVYDWFLILRKLIKHNMFWISFEDFLFWTACGLGVFYMLYRENNGVLRWFTVLGATFGMILYKLLASKIFVHIMYSIIYKIMWFIFRVIQVVLKPVKCLFFGIRRFVRFLGRKLKKVKESIKKRLTVCRKTIRMILHKQ